MKKDDVSILKPSLKTSQEIPLFTSAIKAGFPSPAEDYIENKLDLNEHLITNPPATFFVKVEGDSMINANIFKDDILIVDRSKTAQDKTIIVAIINGEFTVKRIRMKNSEIFLEAENPAYPLIKIDKISDFEIWGVVTYIIHKAK